MEHRDGVPWWISLPAIMVLRRGITWARVPNASKNENYGFLLTRGFSLLKASGFIRISVYQTRHFTFSPSNSNGITTWGEKRDGKIPRRGPSSQFVGQ